MSNNHEPPAWKPPCEMIPTSEQRKNKMSERLQRGNWPEENSIWLLNSSSVSRNSVGDGFKVWGSSISPKLPIKCEGRMVKFFLYKLSKHCIHIKCFSGTSWRRQFIKTGENQETQLGEVKRVPRTPRPRGGEDQSTLESTWICTKSKESLLEPRVYEWRGIKH